MFFYCYNLSILLFYASTYFELHISKLNIIRSNLQQVIYELKVESLIRSLFIGI